MNTINILTENTNIPNREKFLSVCSSTLERISTRAPSDNEVILTIDYDGEHFFLEIEMVSSDLVFSILSQAKSPFVALDKALKDSLDRINKWLTLRQIRSA